MIKRQSKLRFHTDPQFNMTPMIDVVFLLIIFFMLICQFITSENYKLVVPDDCDNAITNTALDKNAITVSVFPAEQQNDKIYYAVRSAIFDPTTAEYLNNNPQLLADMTASIIEQTKNKTNPLVYLRADRDLSYYQVQNAMIALAQAGITKVQLAAFRAEQDKPGIE